MTLEGAINLNETADYIIYTMNSVTTGQYGVVIPKNINGTLNMLVDLHMKGSFDGVGNGTKTKEQLVSEISEEYNKLKTKYVDGMLVMPMIDEAMFKSAVANNDKQKMFDEVKKIGAITSELYKKLTVSGIDKQKIDQKIIIVEKNQDDEKFVVWLKEQMPNFVDGILYSELSSVQEVTNPFVNAGSIFEAATTVEKKEETPVVSAPVSGGGIFDNIAPVTAVNSVDSVISNAPVADAPVAPEVVESSAPVAPVIPEAPVESAAPANVDIFGIPLDVQGLQSAPEVASTPTNDNVVVQNTVAPADVVAPTPVVEAPKPVESAALEGTTTFNPIPDATINSGNVSEDSAEGEVNVTEHASKGFANLLILLVILIGVTIISIELGKYLYSVYGA